MELRIVHLATTCLAALLAAPPAGAEAFLPEVAPAPTRIELAGAGGRDLRSGTRLVFHNPGRSASRLLFSRGDAADIRCRTDGDSTSEPRSGQFVLAAGAELSCSPRRGSYEFELLRVRAGAVDRTEHALQVE